MPASSTLLHANILLFSDRAHIYRRLTASPDFAQSFAIHLAAFASLDGRARDRIIEIAPDVLSCTVDTPGLIAQLDPLAPTSAYSTGLWPNNLSEQRPDGIIVRRPWLAAPAQELYAVSREGVENFRPLPINGAKPWKYLRKLDLAPLGSWTLRRGDIVNVDTGHSTAPAKPSEIRSLGDGRFVVVYCWLYTREDILGELKIDGAVPLSALANLNQMWPPGVRYSYMLSTNRTISIWDTAIERVPPEISSSLCYSAIYSTTPTSRRIWSIDNKRFQWMKRILHLEPAEIVA
ncbi:hypothetical protein N7478_010758 [Penicillium angulare]|uniref:uncharacterized protein n=1 Tax=Penicillium angulare TaxID=116970 RepID=UPI00253FB6B8|nr:uncharacterized protein N7478_010758 [Penicillium angulare]KAJ5263153.1 hypothetical protein N7478_010758 [Penicillium angulare]